MATILVAEDNAAERGLLARGLAADGHTVLEAENGQIALQLLAAHTPAVQAIVTDLEMPEVDGIELAERALAASPSVRILLISGMAGGMDRANALVAKGARTLVKPVALEKVRAEIRSMLGT